MDGFLAEEAGAMRLQLSTPRCASASADSCFCPGQGLRLARPRTLEEGKTEDGKWVWRAAKAHLLGAELQQVGVPSLCARDT